MSYFFNRLNNRFKNDSETRPETSPFIFATICSTFTPKEAHHFIQDRNDPRSGKAPMNMETSRMQTIALVDDDRNILTSVSIALEAEGYKVETYTDGASALDGLLARPPHLAIFDIKMPRMDGMELLRRLRQKSDIPVIFLTSKDEEIDELFGLKMGADDFITKPFSQRLLVERVKAILRRASSRKRQHPPARPAARQNPERLPPVRWNAASSSWTRSGTPAPGRASR